MKYYNPKVFKPIDRVYNIVKIDKDSVEYKRPLGDVLKSLDEVFQQRYAGPWYWFDNGTLYKGMLEKASWFKKLKPKEVVFDMTEYRAYSRSKEKLVEAYEVYYGPLPKRVHPIYLSSVGLWFLKIRR